jgi:hypothetical protein
MDNAKRGRPLTGKAMTAAERQRVSRAKRLSERYESFSALQVNFLLSAQAAQALDYLRKWRDKSRKSIIEEILISAYADHKTGDIFSDKSQILFKDKTKSVSVQVPKSKPADAPKTQGSFAFK